MSLLKNYLKEGKIQTSLIESNVDTCGLIVSSGLDFDYVEEFSTDKEGNVIDRMPITVEFALKLRDMLNLSLEQQIFKEETRREKIIFGINIEKDVMQQLIELNENNNHVAWVMPEKSMEISYDTPLNERKTQIIWFPETMFQVYGNSLSIYYYIGKKKYKVLLPNIYDDGHICMGNNEIRTIKEFASLRSFIDYHEDLFFNSPFNVFHYTSIEITEKLNGKNIWQIHEEIENLPNSQEKKKALLPYLTMAK